MPICFHTSPYYQDKYEGETLVNSDHFSDSLLRLPMFYELDVKKVINCILKF